MTGRLWKVAQSSVRRFVDDECLVRGASLAYYTVFSLPPLLVIVFLIAESAGVPPQTVDRFARRQIGVPVPHTSDRGEGSLGDVVERARLSDGIGPFARAFGLAVLLLSATGVVAQLQQALNEAWDVEPAEDQPFWGRLLVKRLLSLAMVAVLGLILLVSLVLSTLVDEIAAALVLLVGGELGVALVLNALLGFVVATLVFAAVFKLLPDAETSWQNVLGGALFTAVLFTIGKSVLGWHLRTASVDSPWGAAAGSLVALLVWVYYTSLIVLFGAEATRAWVDSETDHQGATTKDFA